MPDHLSVNTSLLKIGERVMRMFLRSSLCALVALVCVRSAPADDPKPKELTGDAKAFQGTWISKDDDGESTWVFKDDTLKLDTPSRHYKIVWKLDSDAKPHKTLDLDAKSDSPNAPGFVGKSIYKIEGDKLTICMGTENRPEEFKLDFPAAILFELTRKK
jgi:uncharacterized protein (TIGR03067 family)